MGVIGMKVTDTPAWRDSNFVNGNVANKRWVTEAPVIQPFSSSDDVMADWKSISRNRLAKGKSGGRDWGKTLVDKQTDEPPSKRAAGEDPDEIIRKANEEINRLKAFDIAKAVHEKVGIAPLSNEVIRLLSGFQNKMGAVHIQEQAKTTAANVERATRNFGSLEGPTPSEADEEGSSTSSVSTGRKGTKKNKKKQQGGKGKDKKH